MHTKLSGWHATTDEVRQGFRRRVEQAKVDAFPLITPSMVDPAAHEHLWSTLEGELERAQKDLYDAWNRMHTVLGGAEIVAEDVLLREERRLDEGSLELELIFEEGKRESRANAARAIRTFAMHYDARMRACSGCGANLGAPLIVMTQKLVCRGCGTRMTVEPGMAFHIFASSGARWLGEWYAFDDYQLMRRQELRIRAFPRKEDVPLVVLQTFYRASLDYWTAAIGIEANLVPYLEPHLDRLIDARMKDARKLLRSYWQWRAYEEALRRSGDTTPDAAAQPSETAHESENAQRPRTADRTKDRIFRDRGR